MGLLCGFSKGIDLLPSVHTHINNIAKRTNILCAALNEFKLVHFSRLHVLIDVGADYPERNHQKMIIKM